MKSLITLSCALLISGSAFGHSLACTLQSGSKLSLVVLDIENQKNLEEGKDGKYVYDLSIYLQGTCQRNNCSGTVTINSGIVEDELTQVSFDFSKQTTGVVYKQALKNTPDKRKYTLLCEVIAADKKLK